MARSKNIPYNVQRSCDLINHENAFNCNISQAVGEWLVSHAAAGKVCAQFGSRSELSSPATYLKLVNILRFQSCLSCLRSAIFNYKKRFDILVPSPYLTERDNACAPLKPLEPVNVGKCLCRMSILAKIYLLIRKHKRGATVLRWFTVLKRKVCWLQGFEETPMIRLAWLRELTFLNSWIWPVTYGLSQQEICSIEYSWLLNALDTCVSTACFEVE